MAGAADAEQQEAKAKGVSVDELRKIKTMEEDLVQQRLQQNKGGSALLNAITGRPVITYTHPRGQKD